MMERLDRFESMLQDGISPEELQQFLRILRIMEKNMM